MRLFVGLPVPQPLGEELVRAVRRISVPNGRFTRVENLHVTLYFLGEVGQGQLANLERAIDAVPVRTIELEIGNVGAFPRGGVLFAEVQKSSALASLQAAVAIAVAPFGARPDPNSPPFGEYHPHITLLRTRDKLRLNRGAAPWLCGPSRFRPEYMNLYHSCSTRAGSIYEVVYRRALSPVRDAHGLVSAS